ncbi:IS5 family transposase [Streptomyces sp. NPDC055692]|uniref:IS5 family transposase n=2 Tax=unclassified Streptomyces TaxID=2593676 RepID=UPI003435353A
MPVFVAGGTGVLGRRLVPQLVARGHEVTATTTTEAKLDLVQQLGATGVVMDGLDAASVGEAVAKARPEVIAHQMTAISMAYAGKPDIKHPDRWFALTNRMRREGTDHLLGAAEATGVTHVVAQGYASWNGIREGGWVKTEEDPLDMLVGTAAQVGLETLRYAEDAVLQAGGAVLRYGAFYGPGAIDDQIELIRKRQYPLVGRGTGYSSWIHLDDAASATVLAMDARWELIEPVLAAWRAERRRYALDIGRPPEHELREIMNAILYVDRTGVQWRYLPHDFPPWETVYGYFAKWQKEGVFAQLNGVLRRLLRQQEGKDAEPSACVIDAQSVKTSTSVPAAGQGTDAAKKIVGRKGASSPTPSDCSWRCWSAASVQDSVAGAQLVDQVAAAHPTIRRVWVDGGYRRNLVEYAARLGIDMEIVQRTPGTRGFAPLPKRWTVERTYGWLMFHRRLARDYETLPARSEAMIHLAMTDLMARRLTGEATVSWRDPTKSHQPEIPG